MSLLQATWPQDIVYYLLNQGAKVNRGVGMLLGISCFVNCFFRSRSQCSMWHCGST